MEHRTHVNTISRYTHHTHQQRKLDGGREGGGRERGRERGEGRERGRRERYNDDEEDVLP